MTRICMVIYDRSDSFVVCVNVLFYTDIHILARLSNLPIYSFIQSLSPSLPLFLSLSLYLSLFL